MRKILLIIITGLIIGFIIPTKAKAVSYSIEDMTIEAYLQEDGLVHVYELQTYSFDSSFNGITRTLFPKENTIIENFVAFEIFDISDPEEKRQLNVELENNTFRIHRPGDSGEEIMILTAYTISEGLEVYEDVVQFYWPFFDKRNESTYENLNIIVFPPKPTEVIDTIGYDAAENKEEVFETGVVGFELGMVKYGKNGDIRVLYDSSSFSKATLTKEGKMKESLLQDIKSDREDLAKRQKRISRLEKVSPMILTFAGALLAFLLISALFKRRSTLNDVERSYTPAYFVPKDRISLPAMIFFMRKTKLAFSQLLNVAFLDLVRRGFVKQVDDQVFTVVNRNTPHEHEVFLINWLFDKIGKNDTLHIDQLEEYVANQEEAIEFQRDFREWSNYINLEISKNDLEEVISLPRVIAILIELFLFMFIIVYGIHGMFAQLGIAVVFNVIALVIIATYQPKTVKGIMIKRDWDYFVEKYIHEPEKYLRDLSEDERARAYLYSFAIENKDINEVNQTLSQGQTLTNLTPLDPSYFLIFTMEAEKYFIAAYQKSYIHYRASSASGGGRGGVGGGGGGSGAF